jgi:hypothetical protein
MKAEAANYLSRAREDLSDARQIAGIGLAKVAARSAYYAAFTAPTDMPSPADLRRSQCPNPNASIAAARH